MRCLRVWGHFSTVFPGWVEELRGAGPFSAAVNNTALFLFKMATQNSLRLFKAEWSSRTGWRVTDASLSTDYFILFLYLVIFLRTEADVVNINRRQSTLIITEPLDTRQNLAWAEFFKVKCVKFVWRLFFKEAHLTFRIYETVSWASLKNDAKKEQF